MICKICGPADADQCFICRDNTVICAPCYRKRMDKMINCDRCATEIIRSPPVKIGDEKICVPCCEVVRMDIDQFKKQLERERREAERLSKENHAIIQLMGADVKALLVLLRSLEEKTKPGHGDPHSCYDFSTTNCNGCNAYVRDMSDELLKHSETCRYTGAQACQKILKEKLDKAARL